MPVLNSESRMSKSEGNPKPDLRMRSSFDSGFGFRASFAFRHSGFGIALLGVFLACGAPAQGFYNTGGGEYAIAGHLPGDEDFPQISINADGGYLVWHDNASDRDGLGIRAAALDSSLSLVQAPFRVNQVTKGDQERPRVALLNNGGAVFVWQGGRHGFQHIYARFTSSSNTWVTGDVQVNTFARAVHANPVVATLTNGNVVVLWDSFDQVSITSMKDVYGQVFSPTGQRIGGEFLLNQFPPFNQRPPSVAALANGGFVAVWVSDQQRSGDLSFPDSAAPTYSTNLPTPRVAVYGRLFDGSGSPVGDEFILNTASDPCANPTVAAAPDGGFLVAWSQRDTHVFNNGWDIVARPFSSIALGGATRFVNSHIVGDQFAPHASINGSDYLLVWTSLGQDGSWEGVYGQFLQTDGTPSGSEFRVNTTTISKQQHPGLASDGSGRFLAVWSGFIGGPSSFDLFAQTYTAPGYVASHPNPNHHGPLPLDAFPTNVP